MNSAKTAHGHGQHAAARAMDPRAARQTARLVAMSRDDGARVTPAAASAFARLAAAAWAHDPEAAHEAEFRFRTRAMLAIAARELDCADARAVCGTLAALGARPDLRRWFA